MRKTLLVIFGILFCFGLANSQTEAPSDYQYFGGDSLKGFNLQGCFSEMQEYDHSIHLNEAEKRAFMLVREKAFVQQKFHLHGPVFDATACRAKNTVGLPNAPVQAGRKMVDGRNTMSSALATPSVAQGMAGCDNLDWEDNNVSNWSGSMGYITTTSMMQYGMAPLNGPPANGQAAFVGPHNAAEPSCSGVTLVSTGTDPFANTPMVGAGSFSARLGGEKVNVGNTFGPCGFGDTSTPNESAGETISQDIVITSANCMITYNYNVILADGGHPANNQPFFEAVALDAAGNEIPCSLYFQECTPGVPPQGYATSALKDPIDATAPVYYSGWQSNTFDLSPYIGSKITLIFMVAGCVPGGHFGYAYVDGHCGPKLFPTVGPTACNGSNETITAPPLPPGTTYSWSGPGIVGSSTGSTVVVNTAGTYTVSWTLPAPNSSCPISVSASAQFDVPQTVTLNPTQPSCGNCTDGSITASISGGTPPCAYTWSPAPSNGQGTLTAGGLGAGQYTLTVNCGNGCVTSSVTTLSFGTGLGFKNEIENIAVYPNPASDLLTFEDNTSKPLSCQWTITTALGQQCMGGKLQASASFKQSVDILQLANGIYFLSIETENDRSLRKLVVEH